MQIFLCNKLGTGYLQPGFLQIMDFLGDLASYVFSYRCQGLALLLNDFTLEDQISESQISGYLKLIRADRINRLNLISQEEQSELKCIQRLQGF